jgi:hypothetical protein
LRVLEVERWGEGREREDKEKVSWRMRGGETEREKDTEIQTRKEREEMQKKIEKVYVQDG